MSELRRINKKEHKKKNKGDMNPGLCDIVTEQSLEKNYKILGKVIVYCGSNRKLSMRINHKHFVYIISLPELAWKKCKQTGL